MRKKILRQLEGGPPPLPAIPPPESATAELLAIIINPTLCLNSLVLILQGEYVSQQCLIVQPASMTLFQYLCVNCVNGNHPSFVCVCVCVCACVRATWKAMIVRCANQTRFTWSSAIRAGALSVSVSASQDDVNSRNSGAHRSLNLSLCVHAQHALLDLSFPVLLLPPTPSSSHQLLQYSSIGVISDIVRLIGQFTGKPTRKPACGHGLVNSLTANF